ncbi:MAG: hypothetical protein ABII00_10180 [Elusimicrobiota bacterium]
MSIATERPIKAKDEAVIKHGTFRCIAASPKYENSTAHGAIPASVAPRKVHNPIPDNPAAKFTGASGTTATTFMKNTKAGPHGRLLDSWIGIGDPLARGFRPTRRANSNPAAAPKR